MKKPNFNITFYPVFQRVRNIYYAEITYPVAPNQE